MSYTPPGPHRVDLEAYCARIGFSGEPGPDLLTLHRVLELHTRAIPFENLDVLRGTRVRVDIASVEAKLVGKGRGGYCFEQNTLLLHALLAIGFEVTPVSARVRYQKPVGIIPPRSHLFCIVRIDGEDWVADVGIGGLSLTAAIRLVLGVPQETPHDSRRLVSSGDWTGLTQRSPEAVLLHQARLGDSWENVADFTLEVMHPVDVEMANWFTSTHPDSHFRDRLTVARALPNGRLTLINRELKRRCLDGKVEMRVLSSDAELFECLEVDFGLRLPKLRRFVGPSEGTRPLLE